MRIKVDFKFRVCGRIRVACLFANILGQAQHLLTPEVTDVTKAKKKGEEVVSLLVHCSVPAEEAQRGVAVETQQ